MSMTTNSRSASHTKNQSQHGYVAVSTVLLLSAMILMSAVSLVALGIGESQAAFAGTRGEEALTLVEGCTEDALYKLWENASYTGGAITRPEGSCTIAVSNSNPTYTLTITATSATYTRSIQVVATRTTQLTITSWKEI